MKKQTTVLSSKLNTVTIATLTEKNGGLNPYKRHSLATQRAYLMRQLIAEGKATVGTDSAGNKIYTF